MRSAANQTNETYWDINASKVIGEEKSVHFNVFLRRWCTSHDENQFDWVKVLKIFFWQAHQSSASPSIFPVVGETSFTQPANDSCVRHLHILLHRFRCHSDFIRKKEKKREAKYKQQSVSASPIRSSQFSTTVKGKNVNTHRAFALKTNALSRCQTVVKRRETNGWRIVQKRTQTTAKSVVWMF